MSPRKKKEIPRDEAIDLAYREATAHWLGQKPLFVVFTHEERTQFSFMKPEHAGKGWLFLFVNPFDYSGQSTLKATEELHRRFAICGLQFVLVLCPRYPQLFSGVDGERAVQQQIMRPYHITFPTTVDARKLVSAVFNARYPHVAVLSGGKLGFQASGDKLLTKLETDLQAYLRIADPGIPFPKPLDLPDTTTINAPTSGIEFGAGQPAAITARILGPAGFAEGGPGGLLIGQFPNGTPPKLPGETPVDVLLQGTWLRDGDRLVTADPKASMTFESQGSHVAVVAHSIPKNKSAKDAGSTEMVTTDVFVEINGGHPSDKQLGEGAALRFDGRAVSKIGRAGFYPLLIDLPAGRRTITLRFDSADEVPIAIYAIRHGVRLK